MTQEPHSKPRRTRLRRFLRRLWWFIVAVFLATRAVHWWSEAWWFEANGYASLYGTMFVTQCVMFVVGATLYGGVLWLNIRRARAVVAHSATLPVRPSAKARARPPLLPPDDKAHIDRYRDWILGVLTVLAAWLAGLYGALHWIHLPRFFGAAATGQTDPVFGRDLSFYLFQLPALDFAWGLIYGAGICAILISLLIYTYEGMLELAGARPQLATVALPHLAKLIAGLLVWKALGYSLQRYNLLSRPGGAIYGVGSTEQVWALPVLRLLPWLALATAIYLWWLGTRPPQQGATRRAFAALTLFFGIAFLLGNAIPTILQRTDPLDGLRNSSYLQVHARLTRQAYGLQDVPETYAKSTASGGAGVKGGMDKTAMAKTLDTLPLWSPDSLARFLRGTVSGEATWRLSRPHLDCYRINGEWRPVFVTTRTLDPASRAGDSWQNRHFMDANGDGIVVYDAQRTDAAGHPLVYDKLSTRAPGAAKSGFFYGDFETPPRQGAGFAGAERPMGEPAFSADSSLPGSRDRQQSPFDALNGPLASDESSWERNTLGSNRTPFDYVIRETTNHPTPGSGEAASRAGTNGDGTNGDGGASDIAIGSRWRQWVLGWRFGDLNLALSSQITPTHRIDWHHDVVERCRTLLPFLDFAGAPLPVRREDGRLIWLVDGFSVTNAYPYARPLNDSGGINYLRHSVTATVDAHSGRVTFYIADEDDLFIRLYQRTFPGLFLPLADMPADIRTHLRYPLLQLAAQAEIWARYHANDAKAYLSPHPDWSTLDLADDPFRFLHPNQVPSSYVVRPTAQGLDLLAIWPYTPTNSTPTDSTPTGSLPVSASADTKPTSERPTPVRAAPTLPTAALPDPALGSPALGSPALGNPATSTPAVIAFLMGSRHDRGAETGRPSAWTAPHPVPLPLAFSRLTPTRPTNPTTLLRQAELALPHSIALLPYGRSVLGARAEHENTIETSSPSSATLQPPQSLQHRYLVAAPGVQVLDHSAQNAVNLFFRQEAAAVTPDVVPGHRLVPQNGSRLQRARELYRQMQAARQRRDWATYGIKEDQLGAVLEEQ